MYTSIRGAPHAVAVSDSRGVGSARQHFWVSPIPAMTLLKRSRRNSANLEHCRESQQPRRRSVDNACSTMTSRLLNAHSAHSARTDWIDRWIGQEEQGESRYGPASDDSEQTEPFLPAGERPSVEEWKRRQPHLFLLGLHSAHATAGRRRGSEIDALGPIGCTLGRHRGTANGPGRSLRLAAKRTRQRGAENQDVDNPKAGAKQSRGCLFRSSRVPSRTSPRRPRTSEANEPKRLSKTPIRRSARQKGSRGRCSGSRGGLTEMSKTRTLRPV